MSFALAPFCNNSTNSDGAPTHMVIGTEGTRDDLTPGPCIVLTMSDRPGQGARKEYQQLLYMYTEEGDINFSEWKNNSS